MPEFDIIYILMRLSVVGLWIIGISAIALFLQYFKPTRKIINKWIHN